ncbi:PH domain-containing protein [Porphyromonas pogonae]|uniref:PH domain-containing protein n=1 Tax=Porphyromonas pogonae TaxID=867595 RepID=UPI002E786692|nr:PH domain-containing protein [Porphyromonas pogonae]
MHFENFNISTDNLPDAELLDFEPLQPRYRLGMYVAISLRWFLLLILVWVPQFVIAEYPLYVAWILTAVIALGYVINMLMIREAYRYRGYAVRSHDITYRRGIIRHIVSTIPFRRIQQVTVRQSILARIMGYYHVVIFNASGVSENMIVHGLSYDDALRLKSFIMERIKTDEAS